MYNAADKIAETLRSVSAQTIPSTWRLEVIVVDDGSQDQSPQIVEQFPDERVHLLTRKKNGGRARARNTGLKAASGDYCLYIDADCSYANRHTVHDYILNFQKGIKACFGAVTTDGEGFWDRYQRDNHEHRLKHLNPLNLITTQNFGAEKNLLMHIGGFDTQYQKYGFEDRDLYLAVREYLQNANIRIAPLLKVVHRDHINISEVCSKMFEAGCYTSTIFRTKHPDEYRKMSFARCDLNILPPNIVWFCRPILKSRKVLKLLGEIVLRSKIMPYIIKRYYVKGLSALFYMAGTGASRPQE